MFRCPPHSPPPAAASQPQLVKNGRTQAWGVGSNAPAADTAVSSRFYTGQKRPQRMVHPLFGAMWCGVGALMERWRAAGPRRWVDGSNRTNRINESNRLARPCSPVKPYIYSTYKLTSVLLLYCAHVHRFWQNKTDPANRQIWFVIQFTTSRLDDGDLKRLCHGRKICFVAASAATKQILFACEILPFLMPGALSTTSRR